MALFVLAGRGRGHGRHWWRERPDVQRLSQAAKRGEARRDPRARTSAAANSKRSHRPRRRRGGHEGIRTPAYDASADYVAGKLEDAGYRPRRPQFDFPYFGVFKLVVLPARTDAKDFQPYGLSTDSGVTRSSPTLQRLLEDLPVVPTIDVQIRPAQSPIRLTAAASPGTSSPPPRPKTRWPSFSAAPATSP